VTARIAAIALAVWALAIPAIAAATPIVAPRHQAFALIVTNNRSTTLGRPDLQYADDDGARYYELFRTLAPADHLRLLTEFDRDSVRAFPELAVLAAPASRANVRAAAEAIARQVAAAQRAGTATDFYFVFAGHGDVDHGRGFLELVDGAFYGDDVEALIASVHASRAHIILDSCNSYFVISARKPGGRRFATPIAATTGLAQRSPSVGVFVSTSAEAEVFEWSELQSGVFSHAVRSGLAGAADANHDGEISYDELRAFVDTATSEIRNAAFRPKVFARGPSGDDRAVLFATTTVGQQLTLDASRPIRLTVRDRDDLAWIDVYKEAGAPLTLRLPPGLTPAFADELVVRGGEVSRLRRSELPVPATERVALADLPGAAGPSARGPDQLFRRLFTVPFGPAALARYNAERAAAPAPLFGISHDEAIRMAHLLAQVDDEQREFRWLSGGLVVALGAATMAGAALTPSYIGSELARGSVALGGAALVGLGTYQLFRHPASEHLHGDLERGLTSHADPGQLVANIDRRLHTAAAAAALGRRIELGVGALLVAGSATMYAVGRHEIDYARPVITATAALGAMMIVAGSLESPIERTTRLWDDDPGVALPRIGLVPVARGAALALSGTF
jgi:hypothetical protein